MLSEAPLDLSEPVIYVDGGSKHKKGSLGITVGDGDSSSHAIDIKLNNKKDFSDLSYVLNHILDEVTEVNMHGFLGGRRDHELINYAEAHQFLKQRKIKAKVNFEEKVLAFSKGSWVAEINGVFSVFMFEQGQVSISGECDYKTQNLTALSSHGLSNVGSGEVLIESDVPIFIFLDLKDEMKL